MKRMKIIIAISAIVSLLTSCTKEFTKDNQALQTSKPQQTLHRVGVTAEAPSSVQKTGYYETRNSLSTILPSSVDLSAKMPVVGDQGPQASSPAWAVGYYCKTYQEVIENGWDANRNAYSPSWIYNQINGGVDNGISIEAAMSFVVNNGCDFKSNFPYYLFNYTNNPDDGSVINATHYRSSSYKYLEKTTDDLKSVLASSKVPVISIPVYPDFDNLNADNPVYDNWSGTSRGNAAVCVVGYDDSRQAFRFVNSWGTDWGIDGYGWIAYDKIPYINTACILTDKANTYDTKYLVGDFDGDKTEDILTSNGYAFYFSPGGANGLQKLSESSVSTDYLKVGDFNGDGKSDLFYPTGSKWLVRYSGTGNWVQINTSSVTLSNLKLGDFNGDKKTDVFYPNGSQWKVSYGGTTGWNVLNSSVVTIGYIDLGDFNNDGKSDVFYANGSEWKVSYGGTTGWNKINGSAVTIGYLKLADFNGDGKCDVFYPNGSEWKVCYSGTGDWIRLNSSGVTLKDLGFGNLNSDKKCDVIHATSSYWRVSWGGTTGWNDL